MRRKLIAVLPLAAVSALLISAGAASAGPPTNVSLFDWAAGPPTTTTGSFSATSKTLCTAGTWTTSGITIGMLTLTCSNGTDSLTFVESVGKKHGKTTGIFTVTSGTGAYAGATGQLDFVQDSGTTGIFSGSIS
jgi:hypothetical protein